MPGLGPTPKRVLMLAPDCHIIDRRILQEARSLVAEGYCVTVLSGFESPKEEHYCQDGVGIHRYQYDWDDERIRGIRALIRNERLRLLFHRAFVGCARRFFRFNSFDVFVLNRARTFRADIVHVHDLPLLKHGAHLAREWGAPLVFDAHEIYYEQDVLAARVRRRLKRAEKRYAPRMDLFITVNEGLADCFRKTHGDLNYLVLMNCADRAGGINREASRRRLREMAALGESARIVLYQGWISAERNLDTLVRAAKSLPPDAYLCLIGYGEYQQDLERIVEGESLADRVRFLGRVEPGDILALTAGADVGIIPYLPIDLNHLHCSPNKFFEYVQTGVPMVTHDLPFFRGMNDKYGVAATGDLSSAGGMASAINGLLNDANRLAAMRGSCLKAAETLCWETESRKLIRAYESIRRGMR